MGAPDLRRHALLPHVDAHRVVVALAAQYAALTWLVARWHAAAGARAAAHVITYGRESSRERHLARAPPISQSDRTFVAWGLDWIGSPAQLVREGEQRRTRRRRDGARAAGARARQLHRSFQRWLGNCQRILAHARCGVDHAPGAQRR